MTPKEIHRRATRLFAASLPNDWAIRSQQDQEDYGVDYEIEVIDPGEQPSGVLFKVQQKGQLGGLVTGGDHLVLGGLRVDRVGYFLNELRLPGLLVGVDVESGQVCWRATQGDAEVRRRYDAAARAGQATMTVHIPAANRLPGTERELLAGVEQASRAIAMRLVLQLDVAGLVEAIAGAGADPAAEPLRQQGDLVRMNQYWRRFAAGDPALFDDCVRLLQAESETAEMRFFAGDLMVRLARLSGNHQEEVFTRRHVYALLLRVVRHRDTPLRLQRYVVYEVRATRLQGLADQFLSLTHAHELAKAHSDPLLLSMSGASAAGVATQILDELGRLNRTILRLPTVGLAQVVPVAWARLVMDLAPFAIALRAKGMADLVDRLLRWLEQYAEPCIDLCNQVPERGPDVAAAIAGLLLLSDQRDEAGLQALVGRYGSWTDTLESEDARTLVLEAIDRNAQIIRDRREPGDAPSLDDLRDTFERMAHGLGVDLTDPDDPVAQIVRIGLADLDPTRVLTTCAHLYLRNEGGGIPAQMIGLWSAGPKTLFCRRHPHNGRRGMALDGVWAGFERDHCSGCPDQSPRSESWRWSLEEQQMHDADVATRGILPSGEVK